MKLIVGLGNTGQQYTKTRHNLGFMAIDQLVRLQDWPGLKTVTKFKSLVSQISQPDHNLILAKPTTMMNLSGQAVGDIARFYKVETCDIWVIYDDIDVEFGQMRLRIGGGTAGHNGIKSIVETIGSEFTRFRIGIRNPQSAATPTDQFVLDQFSSAEQETLPLIIANAAIIISKSLADPSVGAQTYNLLSDDTS